MIDRGVEKNISGRYGSKKIFSGMNKDFFRFQEVLEQMR